MKIEDKDMVDFIDNVTESIEDLREVLKVTSLGLDYKKYIKFKVLTPVAFRKRDMSKAISGRRRWTKENCQYCIDFVIESALKLQEFNFNMAEIEDYPFGLEEND